ncbi:hypothetical protein DL98DRAFT_540816 [Cadophora sp. DSE1049]|nr:hypothetical protein DL98DRAFT_540816 [Cadophora sp. DSE1049]
MSHETHQKLDDISQSILKLRDVGDNIFDELHAKISKLLALVELQKKLDELARAIREGTVLPVRRINYNIKKLSEDDEACQIRWSPLQKLSCPAIVFSTMAFNGLISLPDKQYECLVENVQKYIEVQELPCDWIARDQIRRVVAGTPRREGTQSFLQGYHGLEIQLNQDASSDVKKGSARKRKRLEGEHSPSPNQESALELVAQTHETTEACDKAGPSQCALCLLTNGRQLIAKAPKEKTNTNVGYDKTERSQASAKKRTNTYDGDAFIVDIDDARYALSLDEHVGEVWLTNPESKYNASDEKKRSFLTLWISETMGKELGKRSKPMLYCTNGKDGQPTNNENTDACLHK